MSRTGDAFAPRICTHRSGSLAATRVTSRTPCPARLTAALGASMKRRGHQARDHLRHVRDEGDAGVVLLRRHLHERRAEVEDEVVDRAGALVADGVVRRDHPRASDEEVGAAAEGAAALAPGHRVRADVAAEVGAELGEFREHGQLHAGDIGHDGVGERGELCGDDGCGHVGRRRDHDELRRVAGGGATAGAEVDGDAHVRRRCVGEDHVDAAGRSVRGRCWCRAGRRRRRARVR